jgi:putative hemolysin
VLRLLRISPSAEDPVSEQEVEMLLEEGARAVIFEEERDLARRALQLDDQPVRELMTPRPKIVWLDADDPRRTPADRYGEPSLVVPVARGDLDVLLGLASIKDAWARGRSWAKAQSTINAGLASPGPASRPGGRRAGQRGFFGECSGTNEVR